MRLLVGRRRSELEPQSPTRLLESPRSSRPAFHFSSPRRGSCALWICRCPGGPVASPAGSGGRRCAPGTNATKADRIAVQNLLAPSLIKPAKLRVLLVDHSPTVRQKLRKDLESTGGLEITSEADRDDQALELFFASRPEVVIVSAALPVNGGFEVLRCIKRAAPHCAVILTSRSPTQFISETARLLGASGVCSTLDGAAQLRSILQKLLGDSDGQVSEEPAKPGSQGRGIPAGGVCLAE
jgi:CheY-like chemotaxis protein